MNTILRNPDEIYKKSFAIIEEAFRDLSDSIDVKEIKKRAAHATADIEYGKGIILHPDAVSMGVNAIRNGNLIFTDVRMVKAGIRDTAEKRFGCKIKCYLYDRDVAETAKKERVTKSIIAIRKASKILNGAVVAVGNAPTALFELCRLIEEEDIKPALVVGIPVGFVGAAESKEELMKSGIPYISNKGNRGGSSTAAAIVNGLVYLATLPTSKNNGSV